jgi:rod shape determining protein RodA
MKRHVLILIILCLLLILIGLFAIYSATISRLVSKNLSPYFFVKKQLFAFSIGLILSLILLSFPYRVFERLWFPLYIINLILLILVILFGKVSLGAQRWFSIYGFSFQPSELSKLFIILFLSGYFHRAKINNNELIFKDFVISSLLLLSSFLFVFIQPDLGTSIIIFLTGIFIFILAGIPKRYIIKSFMIAMIFLPFFWFLLKPYQQQRIITFLSPEKDPLGSGYQVIQGLIAIGSGRLFGKGWLNGSQTHLNFIPEQHTDFIFTVIAEEFGFVGGLILIALYYLLFYFSWKIYNTIKDEYGKLITGGILFNWLIQTFINLAMVLGLIPVVGVPLPFISYARTSLIINIIMLEFLINISLRN